MDGQRILVVDDSKAVRAAVSLMLISQGYAVVEADDGEQAFSVVDDGGVDLVLTDLHMPNVDGYELIRRMRREATHRFIPILVLTTDCREDTITDLKRMGATGVLQKPIERDGLGAALRRCLG
jgi:two-component system chemotaxis response regulator CheY